MTNQTEINRYLATEVMGREWHELIYGYRSDGDGMFLSSCKTCDFDFLGSVENSKKRSEHINPDYLTNLSDRQDLLEACVGKELWGDFIHEEYVKADAPNIVELMLNLLIPREALATAIYRYLKGEEG